MHSIIFQNTAPDGLYGAGFGRYASRYGRHGIPEQRLDAHGHGQRDGVEVVAALERHDHPAARQVPQLLHDVAVHLGGDLAVAEGIPAGGVEPGRHEDLGGNSIEKFWLEF